jgi:hypothetical protein
MKIERWQSLSAPQRVAALACVAAAAVWSAIWFVPDVHQSEPTALAPVEAPAPAQPPPVAESAPLPTQVAEAHPQAKLPSAQSPVQAKAPLAALREALASDNAGTRIDALRQLAEQGTLEALPELLAQDLARDPELAPTLIRVTAQLSQRAQVPQREAAVAQLSRWLQSESTRASADASGNVSVLVETLAGLRSPLAESALTGVLENEQLPLHVQTLAVEGLAHQASPAAQAALTQFRTQLASSERQGFELELQREAEQATDRALARLSR